MGDYRYLWLHTAKIKVGSDESRHVFNASSIVRGKVPRQCPCTDHSF